MDAILDEHEPDVIDLEVCFLFDFAAEGIDRALAQFDFPAGNTPQLRPFSRADHEYLTCGIEDEGADRGYRPAIPLNRMGCAAWFQLKFIALQDLPQFTEMFDDQIGFARPQLVEPIVASEHRAGKNAAVARRFDVVLHVTHKQRLARGEFVLAENFQNTRPLVPHFDVRMVKETAKTRQCRLRREMLAMNCAQQTRAQPALATEAQELARVRQFTAEVLALPEMGVKPLLHLRQRNLWNG